MKNLVDKRFFVLAVILMVGSFVSYAQSSDRKGYMGIGLGSSLLTGGTYDKPGVGLTLHLINASYIFKHGWGVTLVWAGGAHIFDRVIYFSDGQTIYEIPIEVTANYGVLMIGPMYSIKLRESTSLDLKARVGRFFAGEKFEDNKDNNSYGESRTFSLGYSFATSLRQDIAPRWAVQASVELYSGKMHGLLTSRERLTPVCIMAGIGFRF